MSLKIPNAPFLLPTAKETIKVLAQLRYPKDKEKRKNFLRNPGTVTLNAKEMVHLSRAHKLQEALSRLDTVERTAKALSPQDVTYSIGQQILTKISQADSHHQKGNLTQFYSRKGGGRQEQLLALEVTVCRHEPQPCWFPESGCEDGSGQHNQNEHEAGGLLHRTIAGTCASCIEPSLSHNVTRTSLDWPGTQL